MSWVTVIWSVGAGACLTLAAIHVFVWWKDRTAVANLAFSFMAVAVAVFAALELAMMRAETPEQFGITLRWVHVPVLFIVVSLVVFVRLYLRAGRQWLAWAVIILRTLSLILNFVLSPNINYWHITALRHVSFFGESVSVPTGVPNPWMLVAQSSLLLLVIFVMDATITVWRRGDRRQALIVGGSILLFTATGMAQGVTIAWGIIPMPLTASLFYQGLVLAMACELSYDVVHAGTLARRLQASEAGLRESEERFQIVADAAPVLIWMAGIDKLCTFFNKPWLEFTGRSLEQEMGNGWAEGVHPDDIQRCLKIYTEAFDARQPFVMQYRLRRHDGAYRWVSDQGVPRHGAQGNFTGYIGSCVDVTELMNKEQALRESEERVSLAAEAANLAMWEWDLGTDEVWTTGTRRDLTGPPVPEKATLEDFISRLHDDDRDQVRQALKAAISSGQDFAAEFRVVLSDGGVRWITARGRCVKTADGKNMRFRGVSMDVTAQKDVDDLFRLATESSLSGVVLVNEQGYIMLVNSQVEKLFGYQRKELVGRSVDVLVPERFGIQHPAHRAKFIATPTTRAMGAGRELFARRKDGSEFPVEIGLNPIQTPDGIVVLTTVVDITARKMAEAEALQNREEIGHLSRVAAMGELAASIAHELNQPLSGIVSNAGAGQRFIDRGDVSLEELRELLADISADGRRAGDVIRGIQSMVKKGASTKKQVNLNDLVMNVVQMVHPNAMLHSCELGTFLDPDSPAIEGDPVQLQQVLLNLIINAFDAMRDTPTSRRKVVIATERNEHNAIRISVRDYGTGIPEEVRERMFEQFFTTKGKGLGMGLAIVRSIVKSHGGTIAAENVRDGGARFHFTLPAKSGGPLE
jgi:PAS domain S-box-containing protein